MFSFIIIDDAGFVREIMINALEHLGGRCVGEERNGPAGLELIRQKKTDLIFLDLVLPGMNGVEVFETVKQAGFSARFVFMSTPEFKPRVEKYLAEGHHFLGKPFRKEDIANLVAEIAAQTAQTKEDHG